MEVSDFISKLGTKNKYTYYLNDTLVDLCELLDMYKEILYFEFEDSNTIKIYVKNY